MPPKKVPAKKKKTKKSFKQRLNEGSSDGDSASLSESSYSDNESTYFKRKFKKTQGIARADIFKGEEKRTNAVLRAVERECPDRILDFYQPTGNRLNPKAFPRYVFQDLGDSGVYNNGANGQNGQNGAKLTQNGQNGQNGPNSSMPSQMKANTLTVPSLLAFYSRHKLYSIAKTAPIHAIGDFKALRRVAIVISRRLRAKMFPQWLPTGPNQQNYGLFGPNGPNFNQNGQNGQNGSNALSTEDQLLILKYFSLFSPSSYLAQDNGVSAMGDVDVVTSNGIKHLYDYYLTTQNPSPSSLFFNNDLYNPQHAQVPIALPCSITNKVFVLPAWWVKEYYTKLDEEYSLLHTTLMKKYPIPTPLSTPPMIKSSQYVTNLDKTVEVKETVDIHPFFSGFKVHDFENYNAERMKIYNTMINTLLLKQQKALMMKYRFIDSRTLPTTFNPPPFDPINGLVGLSREISQMVGVETSPIELQNLLIKNTLQVTPVTTLHPTVPLDPTGANGGTPGSNDETMFTILNSDNVVSNSKNAKYKTTKSAKLPQPKIQKGLMVNVLIHSHQSIPLPPPSTSLSLETKWREPYSSCQKVIGTITNESSVLKTVTTTPPIIFPTGGYHSHEIESGVPLPTLPFSIKQPFCYQELGFLPFSRRQYRDIFSHPDWTLYETLALLHFVSKHQADSFFLIKEDPILNVRHSWEGCLDRWLSFCTMASAAGFVTDGAKLSISGSYLAIDQRISESVMTSHFQSWETAQNNEANSNSNKKQNEFKMSKQEFFTLSNHFDPESVQEPTNDKRRNSTANKEKADNSVKTTPSGWIDQGWDVPIVLPIEYEAQSLATPGLVINGLYPVQNMIPESDLKVPKSPLSGPLGAQSPSSNDINQLSLANGFNNVTLTPFCSNSAPNRPLIKIDPTQNFLLSPHYQNDGCFINGQERFGIALDSIPIPTDLFSQLKINQSGPMSLNQVANSIEFCRNLYSVAYSQHYDRGEQALRENGFTTTLHGSYCPHSDPTNTNTVLSTRAAEMSDIYGKFQQATSKELPKSLQKSKKGSKKDQEENSSGFSDPGSDSTQDEGDDGSDDLPRSRRRNAPIRSSIRASTTFVENSSAEDEDSDDQVVVAPVRKAVVAKQAATPKKIIPKNHNESDDDDNNDDEDDDNEDDDEDNGPNYYDGDSDDNFDDLPRKKTVVVAMDAKIDRILEEKMTQKRLIFRLDGHILTKSLSNYLVTAEKDHNAEKERVKAEKEAEMMRNGSKIEKIVLTEEELEEQRIEAVFQAYDAMLRSFVSEDFEDYDDFTINGLHPELADEYGYYDDSEIDEATGKKLKDLEKELVENEAKKHGLSFDDYLIKKQYDVDYANGDTDMAFDDYLIQKRIENEQNNNNNNNNNMKNNNNNNMNRINNNNMMMNSYGDLTNLNGMNNNMNGMNINNNNNNNGIHSFSPGINVMDQSFNPLNSMIPMSLGVQMYPSNNNMGDYGHDNGGNNGNVNGMNHQNGQNGQNNGQNGQNGQNSNPTDQEDDDIDYLVPIPVSFAALKKVRMIPQDNVVANAISNNTPIPQFISDYLVNHFPPVTAGAINHDNDVYTGEVVKNHHHHNHHHRDGNNNNILTNDHHDGTNGTNGTNGANSANDNENNNTKQARDNTTMTDSTTTTTTTTNNDSEVIELSTPHSTTTTSTQNDLKMTQNGQNDLKMTQNGQNDSSSDDESTAFSSSVHVPIIAGYHTRFHAFPSDAISARAQCMLYLIKDLNLSYRSSRWWSKNQMEKRYGTKSTTDRLKRWEGKKQDIMNENLDKYGGLPYEARYNEIDRFVWCSYRIFPLSMFLRLIFLPSNQSNLDGLSDSRLIPRHTSWRYTVPDPQRPDLNDIELLKTLNEAEFALFQVTHQNSQNHTTNVLPPSTSAFSLMNSSHQKEAPYEIDGPFEEDRIAVPCYLVKWQNLGYGLTTWEPKYALSDQDLHIAQYNRISKRPTPQQLQPRQLTPEQQQQRSVRMNQWYSESPFFKAGNRLRPYQVQGINWLIKCYITNKNGILADEMGLGKTVQCITFLEHLRREENNRGPYLVVAPLSTLSNWASEAETWTDMNCLLYHDATSGANGRALLRKYEFFYPGTNITKFNVLITSYEMLLTDVEELSKCHFKYVIIDEGHRLKNKTARLMDSFAYLDIPRRLLLTGTPIQNNTTELWTLLNFLEPTKFSDERAFKAKFGTVEGSEQAENLQKTINPYILRRVKETVEKSIPKKVENIVNVELTRVQKLYYRAVYERNVAFLKAGNGAHNAPKLINIETELRKVCNHPWLVIGAEEKQVREEQLRLIANGQMDSEEQLLTQDERMALLINASGKLGFLEKLLPKLQQQGERVLIFSQMVTMLNFLSEYLTYRGYKHERLDGSVNGDQRAAAIERFTKPNSDRFAFLLSTRAGGVGLNLTSANVVIIFDSDWNPQQDIQAQARAHRIGQKNDVRIYRLITRGTYESEMFARASKKLGLDHAIMKNLEVNEKGQTTMEKKRGKAAINAGRQDIENLLRYGAYGILDNDEDEERKRFFEADIETILAQNTYQVNNEEKPAGTGMSFDGGLKEQQQAHKKQMEKIKNQQIQQNNGQNGGSTEENGPKAISHQKMFFTSEKDSLDLDMSDANFWTKILSASSDDYKYTKDALLSRLTVKKGSQSVYTDEDKRVFFLDLEEGFKRVNQGRSEGKLEINDVDEFVSLLDMIIDRTGTFNEEQRKLAQGWVNDLGKLTTRRVTNTNETTSGYRFYSDSSDDDEDDEDEDAENGENDNENENDEENPGPSSRSRSSTKNLPKKRTFGRHRDGSDSSDYEEHIPSYKPRSRAVGMGGFKPGTREPTEAELVHLRSRLYVNPTNPSPGPNSTNHSSKRRNTNNNNDSEDDDDDGRDGNDLDVLVLKEKAGLDNDIYVTIPRRGKGARPVQQHFVCSVCFCPGELIACDGLCCRLFHRECVPKGAPKLGTLPNNVASLNENSITSPTSSQTIFAAPEPCFVTDGKLVPKDVTEANKWLKKAGKILLQDDGVDYVQGPEGSEQWYNPPKDPSKLQTTRWECAECLNQLWRCTLCKFPVQCVEPKKLDTGLTARNAISEQKKARAEVVRKKRLAARQAAGNEDDDDHDDEEEGSDDDDEEENNNNNNNNDENNDENNKNNNNNENNNENLQPTTSTSSDQPQEQKEAKEPKQQQDGDDSDMFSENSENESNNVNSTTNNNNTTKFNGLASNSEEFNALLASNQICPIDFVSWNHQRNITSPLNNNMSSVAFPHGGKFCSGQLCGKIAHVACIEQNEAFLQREASLGNNPPKLRIWRCSQHGCTKCCSSGLECPVNKERWHEVKKELNIVDLDRSEKNDNYLNIPSPFEYQDYLNTFIEFIPPRVDEYTGNLLPYLPGIKEEAIVNQPTEGATTTLKVIVNDDGSITKTTIVNEKATQSRQKATVANTVYPCLSCNKAFHMKCFPPDTSMYVRPSKRHIICPECSEVAQKTNFGQRLILLSEWTYSIPLVKDRLTIPMHSGPKRSDGLAAMMIKQGNNNNNNKEGELPQFLFFDETKTNSSSQGGSKKPVNKASSSSTTASTGEPRQRAAPKVALLPNGEPKPRGKPGPKPKPKNPDQLAQPTKRKTKAKNSDESSGNDSASDAPAKKLRGKAASNAKKVKQKDYSSESE